MIGPALRAVIDAAAALYGLPGWTFHGERYAPGEVLEAQVMVESSGVPTARHADVSPDIHGDCEPRASYGLLQVEGSTVAGRLTTTHGLNFAILYDPLVGLGWGIQELRDWRRRIFASHPGIGDDELTARALACYNGGGKAQDIDPATQRMRDAAYVDRVGAACQRVRAARSDDSR